MVECPLCYNKSEPFFKDFYFYCNNCKGIFVHKKQLPLSDIEKSRYEYHNNDVNDPHYRQFVSPITNIVLNNCQPGHSGLDFGAGPGPVVSEMLKEKGYNIQLYDPFFHPDLTTLERQYDYIVCCEVVEHFHHPANEFKRLKNLLKPNGSIFIMTYLYDPSIDFATWSYRRDFTHVFFYQAETFDWIKTHYHFSGLTIDGRLVILN